MEAPGARPARSTRKPGGFLDDLPAGKGGLVQNVVEHDRVDIYASGLAWQVEYVFDPAFDVLH